MSKVVAHAANMQYPVTTVFEHFFPVTDELIYFKGTFLLRTVKPHYSAPAFNIIPPIKHTKFGPEKYFHSYLFVGNKENLGIKHNFDQSLEIRYSGV